ncbi:MAG: hypothetical protein MUF04_14730 [Akkermansiaceae bacterium]|nr:hypothetical protein [Akkermansiaceae bacterium]
MRVETVLAKQLHEPMPIASGKFAGDGDAGRDFTVILTLGFSFGCEVISAWLLACAGCHQTPSSSWQHTHFGEITERSTLTLYQPGYGGSFTPESDR